METVHFTQQTFRSLMECFARPGDQQQLEKSQEITGLYSATVSACLTFLDGEVSFYVANECPAIQHEIRAWTGAKLASVDQAHFIIIPANCSQEQAQFALQHAKIGNLVDPQQSATILFELTNEVGNVVHLQGPGIQHTKAVQLNISEQWLQLREVKNKEFPLGVDVLLIHSNASIMALPRTTKIQEVNQTWHT